MCSISYASSWMRISCVRSIRIMLKRNIALIAIVFGVILVISMALWLSEKNEKQCFACAHIQSKWILHILLLFWSFRFFPSLSLSAQFCLAMAVQYRWVCSLNHQNIIRCIHSFPALDVKSYMVCFFFTFICLCQKHAKAKQKIRLFSISCL